MSNKSSSVVIDLTPKKIPGPLDDIECPKCHLVQDNIDAWVGYFNDRDNYRCQDKTCRHGFAIDDYGNYVTRNK